MSSNQRSRIVLAVASTVLAIASCSVTQAQQSSPPDEKPEEIKTGTISGTVVNENGQPIANVSVYVRAVNSTGQGRTTSTNNEGNFQVNGLDRAAYTISAYVPAFVTAPRDTDNAQPVYYRVGDSVRLDLIKGGVLTGTVTSASGEPVVAVRVRAYRIRDANGQPPKNGAPQTAERSTDDRGIFRLYGLSPGTYLVSAGGQGNYFSGVSAYGFDVPTYAPSSTRDTAAEFNVRAGEETTNVDIKYRGEPGRVVSGIATGPTPALPSGTYPGFNITLTPVSDGVPLWSTYSPQPPGSRGFAFFGVADGDYDLMAQSTVGLGEFAISEPRRITVKGADITGLELITKPLGSIKGRVALENSKDPACKGKRRPLFAETLVAAQRNEKDRSKDQAQSLRFTATQTAPDKEGAFTLRNLTPGQYDFNPRFFAKYWYLQSIVLPASAAQPAAGRPASAGRSLEAARNRLTLKSGERASGLTITLAEGAASLRGSIKVGEGERVPAKLYLHLVPAEKEKADDVLRFFATTVNGDGTFAIGNLPPGRYFALIRVAPDNESQWASKLRLPEEADTRAKLRREAEAAKTEIEFKPCQNLTDYQLPPKPPLPGAVARP